MTAPELTVVVPTYDERENVREVAARVAAALPDVPHEIVFVDDDSPDGTWEEIERLAQEDARVRLVHRVGRRGLASAVLEGLLAARGEHVAVMDADLQHDETILSAMLARAREGADVVVGSRYCVNGSVGDWDEGRRRLSWWATRAAHRVLRQRIEDPMSGYFLLRRDVARDAARRVRPRGFKILAEILASSPSLHAVEVPYRFRPRRSGASKMSASVATEYAEFLYERTLGRLLPLRFVRYCTVGLAGAAVQAALLYVLWHRLALPSAAALVVAFEAAIAVNFALNDRWTFRDRRGPGPRAAAWLRYNAVCIVGAATTYAIGLTLLDRGAPWPLAVAPGAVAGATWNYLLSSAVVWKG